MATNEKGTDIEDAAGSMIDEFVDQIAQSFIIGTDDEWYKHHYHRAADEVVVFDDDGVHDRVQIDGRLIEDYVEHVGEVRGWIQLGQLAPAAIKRDKEIKLKEVDA